MEWRNAYTSVMPASIIPGRYVYSLSPRRCTADLAHLFPALFGET